MEMEGSYTSHTIRDMHSSKLYVHEDTVVHPTGWDEGGSSAINVYTGVPLDALAVHQYLKNQPRRNCRAVRSDTLSVKNHIQHGRKV